jgi:S1-C subfamily serine protease
VTALRRAHWYALSLILAWAAVTATCASCVAHVPRPVFRHEPSPAGILVEVECPSGSVWRGSAVAIGPRLVTTAAHVIPCGRAALVLLTLGDGRKVPAYVSVTLEREDLAVLLPTVDVTEHRLRLAPARPGPACFVAAAPARGIHCGRIARVYAGGVIVHTATTAHGNSGAGLFDSSGALVGIVTAKYDRGGGTAQALLMEVLP